MANISRRAVLASSLATGTAFGTGRFSFAAGGATLNDASALNPTSVARHSLIASRIDDRVLEQLRAELREAAEAGRPIAMGAARHSMGGQSLARGGTAFTFDFDACVPNVERGTFTVQAGTRWRHVIARLDAIGWSPAVMQSNNDFGVASTFSVNAHGWPVPYGPFGSTVRAIKLMLADGSLVACSREENTELFRLAMGGYGLFGVIVELEAAMTPNRYLTPSFDRLPAEEFADRFIKICRNPDVAMAYGRLDVSRGDFLKEALIGSYHLLPTPPEGLPKAGAGGLMSSVSRKIYRAQTGSESAKRFRWFTESVVAPRSAGSVTRNTLLNEPVSNLASDDKTRTDILHEYFVPPAAFAEFLVACREVILPSYQELLNVTLRYVAADHDSVLPFAPTDRIAAVMSFPQLKTTAAEADMKRMTIELIDRVTAIGGAFYLPYRLHARPDQVLKAYPRAAEFAAAKRRLDPGLLFRNAMWDAWFAQA